MRIILMHTWANIRKNKGYSIVLWMMTGIVAMLLSIGLLSCFQFGNYVEELGEELNTSEIYYAIPQSGHNEQVTHHMEESDRVQEFWKEEAVWLTEKIKWNDGEREFAMILFDAEAPREVSKWKTVGEAEELQEDSIYLPYLFQLDGGYEIGDELTLEFGSKKFTFTIKGFMEDICFSSPDTLLLGIYTAPEIYSQIKASIDHERYGVQMYFANQDSIDSIVENELRDITGLEGSSTAIGVTESIFSMDRELLYNSRTMMPLVIAVIIIAFAFIIIGVCVLVIRFRIQISIADDMERIGSLMSAGYTSRQIIFSIIFQYQILAITSTIAGIAGSYLVLPVLSDVLAVQSGLKWEQGFSILYTIITYLIVISIILIISWMAARNISKISPVTALRGGLKTHNFKKNHMPLEKTAGSLQILLAVKSMIQNRRQSLMILLTVTATMLAAAFAIVMFYNSVIDTNAFAEIPGTEISNLVAVISPEEDSQKFASDLEGYAEVESTAYLDELSVMVEDKSMTGNVMEDFSQKKTITIYEGRYPKHDNEIALSGTFCKKIGKNIGDTVEVLYGDEKASYLITGFTQGANMEGMHSFFTKAGIERLYPDFPSQYLQIYLREGVNTAIFEKVIKKEFADSIITTDDIDKRYEDYMGAYTKVVSSIGAVILVLTVLIIILVLFFVIYSSVVRQKQQLGVQKALGMTTLQLMHQISLSFILPVMIGIAFGSILGITQTNKMLSLIFKGMGVVQTNFIVEAKYILLFGIGMVLVTYLMALLITSQIRKISVYELVREA